VAAGGEILEQDRDALVLELARRGRGGRVLQRLQAVENEQSPPLAHERGQPPAFVERALRAARQLGVAEEGEGFLEKQVGRSRQLLARALAIEGPRERGIAPRPILGRERRDPLRDQRGLAFATERDEGENAGPRALGATNLEPRPVEQLHFIIAPDQLRRRVPDDAGDVDHAPRRLHGRDLGGQPAQLGFVLEKVEEVVRALNGLAMRELKRHEICVLWRLIGCLVGFRRIPETRVVREEDIDRFLHLAGDVEFHLRVRAARHGGGAQVRLGPKAEANHVNHGIAVAEPAAEHLLDGAIVGRESRLVVREAPLLLDLDLDRIAERAELVGDAAEEDGGPRFHGEPGGRGEAAP
jgi:hypothetical protein